MFKSKDNWKNRLFLTATALSILASVCFVYTRISSSAPREFAEADDFPRGALVYAQFGNLPELLKLWDESALKQKYLQSQNYAEFQNRHLALKLQSRWQEFNAALDFEADAATIADAVNNRAAVAVYDLGKLEFVFIAPVESEKFAATMFFQNRTKFEENKLPDKTIYYSREVKADRGRQKQRIVFANVKGRFILATSEDLLLRTIANLNGKAKKDRLSDDPAFSSLAAKTVTAHLATVWVDQTKLNEDWYFKHYWILQNAQQLKEMRAGMFDFEMSNGKFVERRLLLLNDDAAPLANIPSAEAARLRARIPAEAAFFKMQSVADDKALAIHQILETASVKPTVKSARKHSPRWDSGNSFSYGDDDAGDYYDYLSSGSDFDKNIDEDKSDEDGAIAPADQTPINRSDRLEQILTAANASSMVAISEPEVLENPLFAEFRQATILTLRSPANFNQAEFEKIVSETVQDRLGVAGSELNLTWETKTENKKTWRELELPALGGGLSYALRENQLIFADNLELFKSVLNRKNEQTEQALCNELTVIRLNKRQNAFDKVMQKIEPKEIKQDDDSDVQNAADKDKNRFLTGNIGSLLDAIGDVDRIEIRKKRDANFLNEEISFVLK